MNLADKPNVGRPALHPPNRQTVAPRPPVLISVRRRGQMVGMKSVAAAFCLVIAFVLCGSGARLTAEERKTDAVAQAPSLTDTAALRALEGKTVTLTGEVSLVAVSKSKFHTFIKFKGLPADGFTVIVPSTNLSEIERGAGSNLEAALPGRTITVSGPVSLYQTVPQLELTRPEQLRIHP